MSEISVNDRLYAFLKQFGCNSPVFPNLYGAVIRASINSTIGEVFKKLIHYKILSIVIVDSKQKPIYLVTMTDIIGFLVPFFQVEKTYWFDKIFYGNNRMVHLEKSKNLADTPLSTLISKLRLEKIQTVSNESPILEAVKLMLDTKHRSVVVTGADGHLTNLISQSRILRFVNVMALPIMEKTVRELNLGTGKVICVDQNEKVFTAFRIMWEKSINGIGVLMKGKLIGNISVSDIKLIGWNAEFWDLLGLSAYEYLSEMSKYTQRSTDHVICCRQEDTLGNAIKIMCYYNIHHLYITDYQRQPLSILSIRDILQLLLKKCKFQ